MRSMSFIIAAPLLPSALLLAVDAEGLARLNQPVSGSIPVGLRLSEVFWVAVLTGPALLFLVMAAPYFVNALRSSPTFQAVTRSDSLRGAGRCRA